MIGLDRNPLHERAVALTKIKAGDTLALIDGKFNYYRIVKVESMPENQNYFIGRTKSLSDGKIYGRNFYYTEVGLRPFKNSCGCFWHKSNFVVMGADVYYINATSIENIDYLHYGNLKNIEIALEMRSYFAI